MTDPDVGRDRSPQPGSQPMDKLTADFYVAYTGGQLQAFLHDDGNWYLYAPRPADADGTHTEGAQR
ncbi:MAG TPA: hypothetical protein VKB69_10315 [Micromonosporaceae bacterium]|nr:hypothetical protein [Micromonosporaceae bacterium]